MLGGHSMFCVSTFWPGMVLNQGQLSIVVSDWESYLGNLFCLLSFVGCFIFVSSEKPSERDVR